MTESAKVHLFICERGQLLPRWREAFRSAKGASLGPRGLSKAVDDPLVVWLRLRQGRPADEQVRAVPQAVRSAPLVVLSDLPEDEEGLSVFSAGARGYCNTHSTPAVLQQVAAVVLQGGLWVGESLMQRLVRATAQLQPVPAPRPPGAGDPPAWSAALTDREREVAVALSRGASNKEVGLALGISERTVKFHVSAILEKLGVRDRLQLSLVVNGWQLDGEVAEKSAPTRP